MGAVLKASTNMDDYNEEDAYPQNWGSAAEKWKAKHLIIALECDNVAVTGNGVIDGSGDSFLEMRGFFIRDTLGMVDMSHRKMKISFVPDSLYALLNVQILR